jgi:hypothetical protein
MLVVFFFGACFSILTLDAIDIIGGTLTHISSFGLVGESEALIRI